MRKIIFLTGFFFLLAALGAVYGRILMNKTKGDYSVEILRAGGADFEVEIADTMLKQAKGLSGRKLLGENRGMLFIFPDAAIRSFWMAGMNFPLDIIWIRGDKIVGFSENLPPAGGSDYPFYSPPEPADKVLEITAGTVKKLGIKIGEAVILK